MTFLFTAFSASAHSRDQFHTLSFLVNALNFAKVFELRGHQLVAAYRGLLQPSTDPVGLLLLKSCGP